jgi:tRNA threonylcarbamoyladenosine biosynthesis protein TsaE
MIRLFTRSVDDTRAVAAAIEPLLKAGDVIVLSGDLGAGKTAFVQGLAKALGVIDRVTSPTFTLLQSYVGRLDLHHLDVYRLNNLGEVLDLDLPELLDGDAVVAIEWGEVVAPELPREYLRVRLQLSGVNDAAELRVLEVDAVGMGWQGRSGALERALSPWGLGG